MNSPVAGGIITSRKRSTRRPYLDYGAGPLTVSQGKSRIIAELAGEQPGRRLMIGDGAFGFGRRRTPSIYFIGLWRRCNAPGTGRRVASIHSHGIAGAGPAARGRAARLAGNARHADTRTHSTRAYGAALDERGVTFRDESLRDRFIRDFGDIR